MNTEIKAGDKVFYLTLCGVLKFGFANFVGERFILIDDILWIDEQKMMRWCEKIKKEKVFHI